MRSWLTIPEKFRVKGINSSRNLSKLQQMGLKFKRNFWNLNIILANFAENRQRFAEEFTINNIWWIFSSRYGKLRTMRRKFWASGGKIRKCLKTLRFSDKITLENWLFFLDIWSNIFGISASSPKIYSLGR